jgi:hypothetical protein
MELLRPSRLPAQSDCDQKKAHEDNASREHELLVGTVDRAASARLSIERVASFDRLTNEIDPPQAERREETSPQGA